MKRLAWLLLIAILSSSTVGFSVPASSPQPASTGPSSPPPAPGPGPLALALPNANVVCHNVRLVHLCAWVSDSMILPGSYITIYGSMRTKGEPMPGEIMRVTWHSSTTVTCISVTDEDGIASCSTYVPTRIDGRKVHVKVMLDKYKLMTYFRTKSSRHAGEKQDDE